jgi:hypothetical protein
MVTLVGPLDPVRPAALRDPGGLPGAVGLEDLVQGAHGDLPHGVGVAVLLRLDWQRRGHDLVLALTYRYSFTAGMLLGSGTVTARIELPAADVELS